MEEEPIKIHLPISVSYPALEGAMKSKLIGEYIPKPEEGTEPYAQILDVGIGGSSAAASEVILRVKIKILRTVMKRDEVDLYALATLRYDNATEELYVEQYHVNSRTSSSFYNTALEVLVNKVAHGQIIKKARVSIKDIVIGELIKLNQQLNDGMELKGMRLVGVVNDVRVQDVQPLQNKLILTVEVRGRIEVNVLDLSQLLITPVS